MAHKKEKSDSASRKLYGVGIVVKKGIITKHKTVFLTLLKNTVWIFFFFNEIKCKKGRTRMMQPL